MKLEKKKARDIGDAKKRSKLHEWNNEISRKEILNIYSF